MARASWKGHIRIGDLVCGVGLYTAVSTADRVSFNIVNRKTGNRVERQFVDSETGKPVEREDQVKGYEIEGGNYILIESDDLAKIMPNSDKVLDVKGFIACDDIDKLYFDKPYYLAPADEADVEGLQLIARSMAENKVAAFAEAVLFRRNRSLLIRPDGPALVATMLNFDYEVRSPDSVFKTIPDIQFDEEMLELAGHIISTKQGSFEPADYHDRYEAALVELVKAKIEGRPIPKKKPEPEGKVVDLLQALRESAGLGSKGGAGTSKTRKKTARSSGSERQRKAG